MFGDSFATDAVGLLKDDHREVEDLFARFEASEQPELRIELAQAICQALVLHAQVEEQLFYPALRQAGMDPDLLDEAEVEHQTLARLIDEIDGARADAELFAARIKVLGEYVRHHVEEEETEIMPEARALDLDLDALGEDILALKTRLEARVAERVGPPGACVRVEVMKIDDQGLHS